MTLALWLIVAILLFGSGAVLSLLGLIGFAIFFVVVTLIFLAVLGKVIEQTDQAASRAVSPLNRYNWRALYVLAIAMWPLMLLVASRLNRTSGQEGLGLLLVYMLIAMSFVFTFAASKSRAVEKRGKDSKE